MSQWSKINREAVQISAELGQFERDNRFIQDHYSELLKRYPEQWIAVFAGKVVAAAPDLPTFIRLLDEKGIPSGSVARRFLTRNPPDFEF